MPSDDATPPSPPSPLTLSPDGPREVVDGARAREIVARWEAEVRAWRDSGGGDGGTKLPVGKVVLADKSYTDEGAAVIAAFLRPLAPGISRADLSDVIAGRPEDEALRVLAELCGALSASDLEEVDLSDNALGTKGIEACRPVLAGRGTATHLRSVSLCNNGLSSQTMGVVADLLTETDPDTGGCVAGNLAKIHFYNNMSGEGGCRAFARILAATGGGLADVRFSGTRAGRVGSLVVARALERLGPEGGKGLRRLDLADNTFGEDGANLIAEVVARCPNLRYLNLDECLLGDAGMGRVGAALAGAGPGEGPPPLEGLVLGGNELTRVGAGHVASLLRGGGRGRGGLPRLETLRAEVNEMTSLGVRRIMRALGEGCCPSLEELRLGTNECGRIGAGAVVEAVESGALPALRTVALDDNMFPPETVEALEGALGARLVDMEDNLDDEDADEDLSDDEEDEEDEDEGGDGDGDANADVDALASDLAGAKI